VGGHISDSSSRKVNMDPIQIAQVLHTPPTTATAICLLSTYRLTQILHRVSEQNCWNARKCTTRSYLFMQYPVNDTLKESQKRIMVEYRRCIRKQVRVVYSFGRGHSVVFQNTIVKCKVIPLPARCSPEGG